MDLSLLLLQENHPVKYECELLLYHSFRRPLHNLMIFLYTAQCWKCLYKETLPHIHKHFIDESWLHYKRKGTFIDTKKNERAESAPKLQKLSSFSSSSIVTDQVVSWGLSQPSSSPLNSPSPPSLLA